ncbi:hypothetical protein [Scandinavium goeteborgense]|uniref:Uncharacterized protein n=1 Tax=Scandinavium goeteborgense TaxID=1851514 RepID=A0A4R6DSI2_SCAGO|nr:hypothetical protein [Scandinavium goeteborgense]TDN48081.1 hypothetical protein EC847_12832 [Scandinavium goeteborgense]
MPKPVRLALPSDYRYNHDISLWELSFDKRPLTGVRCEEPTIGAEQYNQAKLAFINACRKSKTDLPAFVFSDVLAWAENEANIVQCSYVLSLLEARNKADYDAVVELLYEDETTPPRYLDIAIIFNGFKTRLSTSHNAINNIKKKVANGQ